MRVYRDTATPYFYYTEVLLGNKLIFPCLPDTAWWNYHSGKNILVLDESI